MSNNAEQLQGVDSTLKDRRVLMGDEGTRVAEFDLVYDYTIINLDHLAQKKLKQPARQDLFFARKQNVRRMRVRPDVAHKLEFVV